MAASEVRFPSFDLSGRVALVTGAARGLGEAISLALAHAGADVVLGLRDASEAPPVAAAIEQTLAKIRAAGKTPGLPATAETVATATASGCRYIYNHLPRLLHAGATDFLNRAR